MIEYKSKKDHYIGNWVELTHTTPHKGDFKHVYFRINDVVYSSWTNKFELAIAQDLMWTKLKA